MGPKVAAMIQFVQATGRRAVVCQPSDLAAALAGENRGDARTFKVDTRRSDRTFPVPSPQISAEAPRTEAEPPPARAVRRGRLGCARSRR